MSRNSSKGEKPSRLRNRPTLGPRVRTTTTEVPGGTTGRYLVLLRADAKDAGISRIEARTGKTLTPASKTLSMLGIESDQRPDGVYFETLGVAVIESSPEQIHGLIAEEVGEAGPIMHVEPERYVYAFAAPGLAPVVEEEESAILVQTTGIEYLLGYRDAVNHVVTKMIERGSAVDELQRKSATAARTDTRLTWGLQATQVASSRFSGKGIHVAVLDTGMDLAGC